MTGTIMLGIDPGELNGIVELYYDNDGPPKVIQALELPGGAVEVGFWVRDFFWQDRVRPMAHNVYVRVLMETWLKRNVSQQRGDARSACEPLGAVKFMCAQAGVNFMTRNPGPPQSISDDLLDASGYWLSGGEGHKRAILKHMLQQLVDEGHLPTVLALNAGAQSIQTGTWVPEPTRKGALTKRRNKA